MATQQHHIVQAVKVERAKCRTDLLYLCNEILGYKDINRRIHGEVIDALQKFPAGTDYWTKTGWLYTPGCPIYNLRGNRRSLTLITRDSMKTTLCSIAHSIQWILAYPNVRILMSTATAKLCTMILQQVKEHFVSNVYLRELFPEHCPPVKKNGKVDDFGNAEQFTTLARTDKTVKEPTFQIATVETKIAGQHVDVAKNDDIVDRENARTPGGLQLVKDYYSFLDPIVDHYQIDRNDIDPEVVKLYGNHGWIDNAGTRYDFCLIGGTRILMSDATHKPISEVVEGDEVIGWRLEKGKRYLRKSKVIACGKYDAKPVNKYTFASGHSVTATPEHKWWKGAWNSGDEYKSLGLHVHKMKKARRLLVPVAKEDSWAAGWLAGFFDGEGTVRKNKNHASAIFTITQSMHNPELIDFTRKALTHLGFRWSEIWHSPSKANNGQSHWKDRCNFCILGGWKERYRFMAQICPIRIRAALPSMFAQLCTTEDKLVSIEDAGLQDVYWFQCETGNYIAEGLCSKNSDAWGGLLDADRIRESQGLAPLYNTVVKSALLKGRSAYDADAVALWEERLPLAELQKKESADMEMTFSQYYLNPIPSSSGLVESEKDIVFIPRKVIDDLMPRLRLHVTVDLHGMEPDAKGKDNDYTAMVLAGFGRDGRPYVVDIFHGRPDPFEVIETIFTWYARYPRIIDFKIQKDHFMRTLAPFLKREQERRRVYPIIVPMPISNDRSKVQKIRGLRPWFRNGDIRFADDLKCRNSLINEIMRFPKYNHDDLLDAIADQLENREGGTESDVIPMERIPAHNIAEPKFYGFQPGTGTPMFSSNQSEWDDITDPNSGRDPRTGY